MNACSDAALSSFLGVVKNILNLIQIIGPILCIISLTITLIKMVSNPDEKKLPNKIKNSILALILLFFIPLIVNVVMSMAGDSTDLSSCWNSANGSGNSLTFIPIDDNGNKRFISNPDDYQKGNKNTDDSINNTNNGNNSSNGSQNNSNDSKLVKKEETDTLKVYIYNSGSYYITHIWAKNPYLQLNKYDSPQYGNTLYRPSALLNRAVSEKGLSQKLVVGFNASGFYLKNTYDSASVNAYPAYDKTSVGSLVITDGRVVRNAYNHAVKTWYIAGVDQSNTLRIYEDAASKDSSSKKAWSESVIGKVRNTFTFASPLVTNGSASKVTTSMPSPNSSKNRQAFCQIDNNNFLLITGSNLNRNDLINIMLGAKCRTGTNFDGGGSIALLYKSRSSSKIESIIGDRRSLSEVGYFSE